MKLSFKYIIRILNSKIMVNKKTKNVAKQLDTYNLIKRYLPIRWKNIKKKNELYRTLIKHYDTKKLCVKASNFSRCTVSRWYKNSINFSSSKYWNSNQRSHLVKKGLKLHNILKRVSGVVKNTYYKLIKQMHCWTKFKNHSNLIIKFNNYDKETFWFLTQPFNRLTSIKYNNNLMLFQRINYQNAFWKFRILPLIFLDYFNYKFWNERDSFASMGFKYISSLDESLLKKIKQTSLVIIPQFNFFKAIHQFLILTYSNLVNYKIALKKYKKLKNIRAIKIYIKNIIKWHYMKLNLKRLHFAKKIKKCKIKTILNKYQIYNIKHKKLLYKKYIQRFHSKKKICKMISKSLSCNHFVTKKNQDLKRKRANINSGIYHKFKHNLYKIKKYLYINRNISDFLNRQNQRIKKRVKSKTLRFWKKKNLLASNKKGSWKFRPKIRPIRVYKTALRLARPALARAWADKKRPKKRVKKKNWIRSFQANSLRMAWHWRYRKEDKRKKRTKRYIIHSNHWRSYTKKLKIIKKKNLFLTLFGQNIIYSNWNTKYTLHHLSRKIRRTIFSTIRYDFMPFYTGVLAMTSDWEINANYGYLYRRILNTEHSLTWNYWSTYFVQNASISQNSQQSRYILTDRKRYTTIKNSIIRKKLVWWKKGVPWINRILLKRRLYGKKDFLARTKRTRWRLYKTYRNFKLPHKFVNSKFYIKLWYNNYSIKRPRPTLYRWRYRKMLVLKSLRYFYGQISKRQFLKLAQLVDNRLSIYHNRYDRYLSKMDNKLLIQTQKLGLSHTSLWSREYVKNGWITVSNPDKEYMFLQNLNLIKKFTFPVNIIDPKNCYFNNRNKTYKYEQFKYLLLPQRKNDYRVGEGDLLNFIYSNKNFLSKFSKEDRLVYNKLPLNKNILMGNVVEHTVMSRVRWPVIKQRETYNQAVILFNPRVQDLQNLDRIDTETILFSLKNSRSL